MMQRNDLFTILDDVESTNNYAMGQVHAGLAAHGQAWFANDQWGGRGQREKKWISAKGENIIMTIVVKSNKVFNGNLFLFSACIAGICYRFFSGYAGRGCTIKWPNDIYFGDRKAGGILIENIFNGKEWKWAVMGIGININQTQFAEEVMNPVSLKLITEKDYHVIEIAKLLQQAIVDELNGSSVNILDNYLKYYNDNLYKKGSQVKLKKDNIIFETCIREVNTFGQLITEDVMERVFEFGEVSFVI